MAWLRFCKLLIYKWIRLLPNGDSLRCLPFRLRRIYPAVKIQPVEVAWLRFKAGKAGLLLTEGVRALAPGEYKPRHVVYVAGSLNLISAQAGDLRHLFAFAEAKGLG
jgi:hypothetical protein